MSLDVAAYDAVLKESYEGTIRDILNSRTKTLELFTKDSDSWEGRHVRYPLNVGRNEGVMYTSENGHLPDAGNQVTTEVQVPMRYMHGRIQLSIQVMKHSATSKGAFKRAMDQEMSGLIRDISNERNRVMFGYGKGVLGLVSGDPGTGTTFNMKDPGGVAGTVSPARWVRKNMNVAFMTAGGTIHGTARLITARDATVTTLTCAAMDAAVLADDIVVRAAKTSTSAVGNTAYDKEAMGLLGLIDDGTYLVTLHNVSRTTYPQFKSPVLSAVGPLSADIIQRGIDLADQSGEGVTEKFVCHHSVRRAYLALMEADRRYTMESLKKPDAGTVAAKERDVTYGDVPWIVDKDCHFGMLFGVDRSYNTHYVECEGEWADDDGTILLRLVDTDAYEARYRIFENFMNERPAASFRLDGITANAVTVAIE